MTYDLGPYECFRDASYYDMWCVRRVHDREFTHSLHLVNGDEAAGLRDMLNAKHTQTAALLEALEPFAAHVEAVRAAFPNDPVTAGEVCRGSVSFGDFERAFAAISQARSNPA